MLLWSWGLRHFRQVQSPLHSTYVSSNQVFRQNKWSSDRLFRVYALFCVNLRPKRVKFAQKLRTHATICRKSIMSKTKLGDEKSQDKIACVCAGLNSTYCPIVFLLVLILLQVTLLCGPNEFWVRSGGPKYQT
jgi:hypothetical protein